MNRRKWLRIILLAAIAVTALAALVWWTSRPRISQATADRIREGMTEQQVIDIVGLPPGSYCSERSFWKQILRANWAVDFQSGKSRIGRPGSWYYRHYWIFEDRILYVDFRDGLSLGAAGYHEIPIGFWDWVRSTIRI